MDNQKSFNITDSEMNFKIATKNFAKYKQQDLYEKDVLFLPEVSGQNEYIFQDVKEFIDYLKEQELQFSYGLCTDTDEMLSYNDISIWLGSFLTSLAQNPYFINILSNFLYDNFIKFGKNPNIKFSLNVVETKDKKSKTLKYEGDAESFRNIAPDIIKGFNNAFTEKN